jgi:hypothetical protein
MTQIILEIGLGLAAGWFYIPAPGRKNAARR